MTTPSATDRMFTAAGAAKACKVGRSTVHRYLDQGRLPGAERDADGVWQIPLSALLSVGWKPGRSPSVVDGDRGRVRDGDRDSDRHVSIEVHELKLELERARAEARVHANKVQALEEVVSIYRRMLEAPPAPTTVAPESPPQQEPMPTPQVAPTPPPTGTPGAGRPQAGRFRRAWNNLRYG